jgi:hypothetical protein
VFFFSSRQHPYFWEILSCTPNKNIIYSAKIDLFTFISSLYQDSLLFCVYSTVKKFWSSETNPFRAFVHNHVGLSLSGLLYTISWDYPFQGFCRRYLWDCRVSLSGLLYMIFKTIPFRTFVYTIVWDCPFQGFCTRHRETIPFRAFVDGIVRLLPVYRVSLSGLL